jgi:hypothetical protein
VLVGGEVRSLPLWRENCRPLNLFRFQLNLKQQRNLDRLQAQPFPVFINGVQQCL